MATICTSILVCVKWLKTGMKQNSCCKTEFQEKLTQVHMMQRTQLLGHRGSLVVTSMGSQFASLSCLRSLESFGLGQVKVSKESAA